MNKKFEQQYQQQWSVDEVFEEYVAAWMAYHKAADEVDGHVYRPDPKLLMLAVNAGLEAMRQISPGANLFNDIDPRWQAAKMEALRRMGP